MAYFGKEFTFEKEENYHAFVESFNLPEERAAGFKAYKPNQKIEKNGDTYKLTFQTADKKELTFKSGETLDEPIRDDLKAKTTFTVEGDKITQVQDFGDLQITYVREYTGDKLKLTVTSSKWDGVAYRWYKAL